ncbi:tRNA (N(6)-L-threonylcarbamoyladenosine(37)-C(2))-methylthiotransferase MtaB [Spirochaetia bacterium]|nr:tRNA (N(6)-L-threonylcarbamoyladenosine(37)-C(2))-methylthiotransferase MtaB [Spirochaetia bacterium]
MREVDRLPESGVSFYTLGCKLNQLETESVAGAFRAAGFEVLPWESRRRASLILINTCTVTSKAEQKARRLIRLALRENGAPLIVTGCYAQLEAAVLAALRTGHGNGRRLFVVPGAEKDRLLDLPRFLAGAPFTEDTAPAMLEKWLGLQSEGGADGSFRFSPADFSFHTRPFLKIQDGCDRRCAYCRVPLARGGSRSLAAPEVLARLTALESQGAAETVLTGVNIAQYRCPQSGRDLGELLAFLLDNTTGIAIRLSSIEPEPGILNGAFKKALSHPRLRPHFHLSLQSGSAAVLAAMYRPYGPEQVRESIAALRTAKCDPFLACDIICGFPGETEEDFGQTYRLCEETGFAWIHGFPFSPRPGTAAFSRKNRVSERETESRLERLLELSQAGRNAYAARWVGKTVDAVALDSGLLTANYLRISVPSGGESPALPPGGAFRCHIIQALDSRCFDAAGEIVVETAS